ncbi:unannotated protein [freshwater metagenome]|uniref:Unannotated protein n=1 Tax=freshwater metagenome TaxID=449393 RepID=A0A6J7V3P3_9ZZZZ|nr:glycosyltransferase [Actinomycetota bacterium]MSV71278.1 glycosyltransferase [Actinomycetota bacterium]MSZ73597.1 glycosyltransferase [Actinomycetota bacterium]MTA54928.1 glycosyltransferase [Actinomycetota bacterium]
MKILIITHNISSGGAATACRRLIRAFKNQEIQVNLLSVKQSTEPSSLSSVVRRFYSAILSKLDIYICKFLNNGSQHWQSSGLVGLLTARKIKSLDPTVVNIHWIGHATISIRQLKKLNLPIIITMHDEWWLHAINHYDAKSESHGKLSIKNRFIALIFEQKKSFLNQPNVKIISPSSELKLRIKKSLAGKDDHVFIIPNPISSKDFHPLHEYKKIKKVLLYAGGTQDPRKGYDLFLSALNSMNETCEVLVLGKKGVETAGVNKQITITGIQWINSENEMNQIYCESSMTIVPSRQEAFGQVASESVMAGTPVISFEVGGLRDIIKHGLNGFLIQGFDTQRMAELLDKFLLSDNFDSKIISNDARMRFSEEAVVESYLNIL